MMTRYRIPIALLAALLCAVAAADTIHFVKRGRPPMKDLTVESETIDGVKAKSGDGPDALETTFQAYEVARVEYSDDPAIIEQFEMALQQKRSGNVLAYGGAISMLKNIANSPGAAQRSWRKQYGLYHIADILLVWGKIDKAKNAEAIAAFDRLLNAMPKTRFLPDVMRGKGIAYYQSGQYGKARAAFQALKDFQWHTRIAARWRAEASLWMAKVTEAEKKYDKAISEYRSVEGSSSKFPSVKFDAMRGQARCMIALKRYDEAIRFLRKVAESDEAAKEAELMSAVHVMLGDSYYRQEKYDEARWDYLKGLYYFGDRDDVAHAMYGAARMNEILRAKVEGKEMQNQVTAWAIETYRRVIERYSDTPWAGRAEKRLIKMGIMQRKATEDEAVEVKVDEDGNPIDDN